VQIMTSNAERKGNSEKKKKPEINITSLGGAKRQKVGSHTWEKLGRRKEKKT